MNALIWYVPAAYVATLLTKLPLGRAMASLPEGRYDNHLPRSQQDRLEGRGARLRAAHLNAIEAFPVFAAAVLIASMAGPAHAAMHGCAVAWFVFRALFQWAYDTDRARLRSTMWAGAVAAVFGLFGAPLYAG